jgi:hypothetical protein
MPRPSTAQGEQSLGTLNDIFFISDRPQGNEQLVRAKHAGTFDMAC